MFREFIEGNSQKFSNFKARRRVTFSRVFIALDCDLLSGDFLSLGRLKWLKKRNQCGRVFLPPNGL